jgi:hypothetical protein
MASTVLPSWVLLNKPHQPLITHLPLPFINLMSLFRLPLMLLTLHYIFYLVNIPNQPTHDATPYLPKNYWDAIKQPDYKEQASSLGCPHKSRALKIMKLGNSSNFLLVKSL